MRDVISRGAAEDAEQAGTAMDLMIAPCRKIAIVLDREYGRHLIPLARERHVWVVTSPSNTAATRTVWADTRHENDAHWASQGVTLVDLASDVANEEACDQIAEAIDEHHGVWAQAEPWTEIEIVGAPFGSGFEEIFRALGVSELATMPRGFVGRRSAPARPASRFHPVKFVETQFSMAHTHFNKVNGQEIPVPHVHQDSAGGVRLARPEELPHRGANAKEGLNPKS